MQINSTNNGVNTSFGTATFSTRAKYILERAGKDAPEVMNKIERLKEIAKTNPKIDVDMYVNDDHKTLYACLVNKSTNDIISTHTENFFTRLVRGPVEFFENMIEKADKVAKKMKD